MPFYRDAGDLIVGTRLKRLSDRFLHEIAAMYRTLEIPFEVSWFPLFYLLNRKDCISVTEIAKELKITHSAVSQLVTTIEKKKLITFIQDENDKRRRLISFSDEGRSLMKELEPIWAAIHTAMTCLLNEKNHSACFLSAMNELEGSLEDKNLHERIIEELKNNHKAQEKKR